MGAIAGAHQDFLSSSTDSDSSVLTKHPAAGELSIEIGNDPGSTAAAHFALHGTDRDVFRVVLDFDLRWIDLDLGDVVTLSHARLGLSAGRKLLVIAIDLDSTRAVWRWTSGGEMSIVIGYLNRIRSAVLTGGSWSSLRR